MMSNEPIPNSLAKGPAPGLPDHPAPDTMLSDDATAAPAPLTTYDFPNEVKEGIVSHLDVNTDRATLLELLCVSQSWWSTAARRLYHSVEFTPGGVVLFLEAAYDHGQARPYPFRSARTRQALALVKHVILHDMSDDAVQAMYRACTPGIALFPAVTTVQVLFADVLPGLEFELMYHPPPAIVVFDKVDVCGWDWCAGLLFRQLAIASYRTVNAHLPLEPWNLLPLSDFAWRNATWDNRSLVHYFQALTVKDVSDPPRNVNGPRSVTLPVGTPHIKSLVTLVTDSRPGALNRVQLMRNVLTSVVRRGDEGMSYPLTSGPWEPNPSSHIQFRLDAPEHEHPPCVVCGAKTEPADRNIGHTFTKAS